MIVRQRKNHLMADGNHITLVRFQHCRLLNNRTKGQNGNLRLIDDWGTHDTTERTHIGHSEGSALCFVWLSLSVLGSLSQIIDSLGHPNQVQTVGIAYYWYNQISGGQRRGHPNIDITLFYNLRT